MPPSRMLRGGCQCGRNLYIVQPPADTVEPARLLFDPAPAHRLSLASPLPTYLRVPLAWYHSQTQPFFADETPALIHRTYEHQHPATAPAATRRNFCGFCGTPLSFWSEDPHPEADYIRLALGSLNTEDLEELDEWADLGEPFEDNDNQRGPGPTGIPWFDSIVEGSRLGRHLEQQKQETRQERVRRHETGTARSADGRVQVEWEVLEWTEGDDDGKVKSSEPSPAKRARLGGDSDSDAARE